MESWPKRVFAITLFVDDLVATKAFYEKVFGVPIEFEDAEIGGVQLRQHPRQPAPDRKPRRS